jgi:hypothetical protein
MDEQNTNMDATDNMTVEERIEHNKIKRAVSESLNEALTISNTNKSNENAGLNWVLNLLNKLMPLTLLAMMGWIALTIVDNQKDLVAMRIKLASMDNAITTFIDKDGKKSATSALLHHSTTVNPCNACHTRNGVVVHTLASLPNAPLLPGDLFERKCGSCHTLDRVLATKKTLDEWRVVVNEMRLKDANWISPKEANIITGFIDQLEKHR